MSSNGEGYGCGSAVMAVVIFFCIVVASIEINANKAQIRQLQKEVREPMRLQRLQREQTDQLQKDVRDLQSDVRGLRKERHQENPDGR